MNLGNQPNIFIFEVGMVTEGLLTGIPAQVTLGIHPMVVVPSTINYGDTSRSPLTQLTPGSLLTRAGRGLRPVSFAGTFGVETRGVGPYIGTGEVRRKRFYNEVIRLPEARTRQQVDDCIDPLTGTPFLRERLLLYDPDKSSFYVNLYDFYNGEKFECHPVSLAQTRAFRNGGASGLVAYTLQVMEVGPLVVGTLATTILEALFSALTTWNAINQAITSYTPEAFVSSAFVLPEVIGTELTASVDAVTGDLQSATNLMGGNAALSADGQSAASQVGIRFLAASDRLAAAASEAALVITGQAQPKPSGPSGTIDWASLDGDGDLAALAQYDAITALRELEDSARWQSVAGVLFGMSREEYIAYLTGGGSGGSLGPKVKGSVRHVVSDTDDGAVIEAAYGVAWADILASNGLTPDEALRAGTVLYIPRPRQRGSPRALSALPVFGSHVGQAAWGSDLALAQEVDAATGDVLIVSGSDCLSQGMDILIEQYADDLLQAANASPETVQSDYVAARLRQIIASDKRIASVDQSNVTIDAFAGAFDLDVSVTGVNGGSVRSGGA